VAAVEGLLVIEEVFPAAAAVFLTTEWLGIVEWTTLLAEAGVGVVVTTLDSATALG